MLLVRHVGALLLPLISTRCNLKIFEGLQLFTKPSYEISLLLTGFYSNAMLILTASRNHFCCTLFSNNLPAFSKTTAPCIFLGCIFVFGLCLCDSFHSAMMMMSKYL